jgi:acyl-coenzyme A synthetase/AMP-(fatty) acid ligase
MPLVGDQDVVDEFAANAFEEGFGDCVDPLALAEIQRHHVTVFDGVPTMYAMMLADPSLVGTDLSSLRACAVGGQTMPVAKLAEWGAHRRHRHP